jgi:hypothetical protein
MGFFPRGRRNVPRPAHVSYVQLYGIPRRKCPVEAFCGCVVTGRVRQYSRNLESFTVEVMLIILLADTPSLLNSLATLVCVLFRWGGGSSYANVASPSLLIVLVPRLLPHKISRKLPFRQVCAILLQSSFGCSS